MPQEPFYKFHWRSIDSDRMSGYRAGFRWSDDVADLYKPADIAVGQTVADFGCGPGHIAVEFANRVGPEGHVHALDINSDFLELTQENATNAGVANRVTTHQCDGVALPLEDSVLDRISARNTIMYVDDPVATFREFYRILHPGGLAHAIEGDWYAMIVEPVEHELWHAFVNAASHACRNADMGRKLYHSISQAGFEDIKVTIRANVDTEGRLINMIKNMAKYARGSGKLANATIDGVVETVERALKEGNYFVAAPQFTVIGRKPS